MNGQVPHGWPAQVHPPGSERFEDTAMAWLLEVVPPEYRHYGVLRRYPAALARLAREHVGGCLAAARTGFRSARVELSGTLPPHGVQAVLEVYRSEGARLAALAESVALVEAALRGDGGPGGRAAPGAGSTGAETG